MKFPTPSRGDEVGDNARAAHTFKDNLIRIELMETEQKDQEAAATVRRKAEMIELADAFEFAVGGIRQVGIIGIRAARGGRRHASGNR